MKTVFAFIFILGTCVQRTNTQGQKFSIDIWDYNYSMAYTVHYKINEDSVIAISLSGIQNENDKFILNRGITQIEKKKLYDFLSYFPIESLASEYKNQLVSDGDIKKIEIVFKGKRKSIDVENFYQKDIDRLFNEINQVFEKDVIIKYMK